MTDDREGRNNFLVEGNYIHGDHVEPRVQLYVPKEETFPIQLRYIYVVRTTHTTLDVSQESRIDDFWNIDAYRNFPVPSRKLRGIYFIGLDVKEIEATL